MTQSGQLNWCVCTIICACEAEEGTLRPKLSTFPPMELNLEGLQAIETEADELVVSEE